MQHGPVSFQDRANADSAPLSDATNTAGIPNTEVADPAKNAVGNRKAGKAAKNKKAKTGNEDEEDDGPPGSLNIYLTLDLDIELHLSARIHGDIVIGLL